MSTADSHHGGLENLTARLETIGGRLTVTLCDGQFDLLAEVGRRRQACGHVRSEPRPVGTRDAAVTVS